MFIVKTQLGDMILMDQYMDYKTRAMLILASQYGIRTHGKFIIVHATVLSSQGERTVRQFLETKGVSGYKICLVGKNLNKEHIYRLGMMPFDVTKWKNKPTDAQISWATKMVKRMSGDKSFLLGQVDIRRSLTSNKESLVEYENKYKSLYDELKNRKTTETIIGDGVKNIKNMHWIQSLRLKEEGSLLLRTKDMACLHVPNISNYIRIGDIERHDILYKIMKYQFLGKYFIVLSNDYVIPANYNIVGEENRKIIEETDREIKNLIRSKTYFRGTACHIGDGQICSGEFSSSISMAHKTGLDLFLMNFEAYLRSINIGDAAGRRYHYLPMGNEKGEIEMWPAFDYQIKKVMKTSLKGLERSKKGYTEMAKKLDSSYFNFGLDYSTSSSIGSEENGLDLIKQREPDVYEKIMNLRKERGMA